MRFKEIVRGLGINKRTTIEICKRDGITMLAPRDTPSILVGVGG